MDSSPFFTSPTQYMSLANDLPYDIWLHITGFLTTNDVKTLYSVNSALFHISLNERYKVQCITYLGYSATGKALHRLLDPDVASRVKSFTLSAGNICEALQQESKSRRLRLSNAISEWRIRNGWKKLKHGVDMPGIVETKFKNVTQIMRNLVSLTAFSIGVLHDQHPAFVKSNLAFIQEGWSTFGSNLTVLGLSIPLEDMQLVISPQLKFPNLEIISFDYKKFDPSSDADELACRTLLPFLTNHRATLQSIKLETAVELDPSLLLRRLDLMPSLQNFTASLFHTDLSGIHQLLSNHQSQMRSLTLKLHCIYCETPGPEEWYSRSFFHLTMPLESLHIDLYLPAEFTFDFADNLIAYIHRFQSTLTTLHVVYPRFSYGQVVRIVDGFSAFRLLRELDIRVRSMSPEFFCYLSANLPSLETLSFYFYLILPYEDNLTDLEFTRDYSIDMARKFPEAMEKYTFPDWGLRFLNPKVMAYARFAPDFTKYRGALVKAFPNVESFCGMTPHQYNVEPSSCKCPLCV
ncbi:hypothetical protein B0H34DRAFT_169113 [Crassisporium funariophilum]|nr:hypothetical protein B0H34DRAFT_169113 [Crassisporium funariophilum]